jgi:hypothetical protein
MRSVLRTRLGLAHHRRRRCKSRRPHCAMQLHYSTDTRAVEVYSCRLARCLCSNAVYPSWACENRSLARLVHHRILTLCGLHEVSGANTLASTPVLRRWPCCCYGTRTI